MQRIAPFYVSYMDLLKKLLTEGRLAEPKGRLTKELLRTKFNYIVTKVKLDTQSNETYLQLPLLISSGRFLPIAFNLFECLWIIAGDDKVNPLDFYNSRMKDYSDDGVTFNAPYGYRIFTNPFDQFKAALQRLVNDPDTRQAVIEIWRTDDLIKTSKDIPCNDLIFFKYRGDTLYMTVHNRSNDIHWGLPTNLIQFSFLGALMFKCLQRKYKELKHLDIEHTSDSMHIYLDKIEAIPVSYIRRHYGLKSTTKKWNYLFNKTKDYIEKSISDLGKVSVLQNLEVEGRSFLDGVLGGGTVDGANIYESNSLLFEVNKYLDFFDIGFFEIKNANSDPIDYYIDLRNTIIDFYQGMISLNSRIISPAQIRESNFYNHYNRVIKGGEFSYFAQCMKVLLVFKQFKQKGLLSESYLEFSSMRKDFKIAISTYMANIIIKRLAKQINNGLPYDETDVSNIRYLVALNSQSSSEQNIFWHQF